MIDNLFQVHGHSVEGYLIKLRILRVLAAAQDETIQLKRLVGVLADFEYSPILVLDGLNEVKSIRKRLILSDTTEADFEDIDQLQLLGASSLSLSSIGAGYLNLCRSLDYVQEVMLDTFVPTSFGQGWDYGRLEDRFEMVLRFLSLLVDYDLAESEKFLKNRGPDEYARAFGSQTLISGEILESIKIVVDRILSSPQVRDHHSRMDEFRVNHLGAYESKLIIVSNWNDEHLSGRSAWGISR